MTASDDNHLEHPSIALLLELIRRPSITPDDAGCQDILAEHLTRLGFECEAMPFGDVKNLWARRGTSGRSCVSQGTPTLYHLAPMTSGKVIHLNQPFVMAIYTLGGQRT